MRELTGKHVLAITVGFFGVIIAVNMVLAVQAVRTFPGLEVKNGYVASQTFDADRRAQEALGWTLVQTYEAGKLRLVMTDAERDDRQRHLLETVVHHDLSRWGREFLAAVTEGESSNVQAAPRPVLN